MTATATRYAVPTAAAWANYAERWINKNTGTLVYGIAVTIDETHAHLAGRRGEARHLNLRTWNRLGMAPAGR